MTTNNSTVICIFMGGKYDPVLVGIACDQDQAIQLLFDSYSLGYNGTAQDWWATQQDKLGLARSVQFIPMTIGAPLDI